MSNKKFAKVPTGSGTTAEALQRLGAILDRESYEWLAMNHPPICAALEAAIAAGASLDDIKRQAWNHTQRPEIVTRITNAARWLVIEDPADWPGAV